MFGTIIIPIVILNIIACFSNVFLAICVFARTKIKSSISIATGVLAISAMIYCLVNVFYLLSYKDLRLALFWHRATWISINLLLLGAFFYSYLAFEEKINFIHLGIILLGTVFFAVIAWTEYGISEVLSVFPFERRIGIAKDLFYIWIVFIVGTFLYRFAGRYKKITGLKKIRIEYSVFGFTLSCMSGIISGIVLPLFGYKEGLYIVPACSMFWASIATFSIVREERLLGIDILTYDIMKFLFMLISIIFLNYFFITFFGRTFNFSPVLSSSLSIGIVTLIIFAMPVKEKFDEYMKSKLLNRRVKYQKLLLECSSAVTSILDIDELLKYIIKSVNAALGTKKIGIFLKDNNGNLKLASSLGFEETSEDYFKDRALVKYLEANKSPFIIGSAWEIFPDSEEMKIARILGVSGGVLILPLVHKNKLIGIMSLDQKKGDGTIFDADDMEILQSLSHEIAVAIENAKLYKELDDAYMNITRALCIAVEEKEGYTMGHSDNVTKYAMAIADKLKLSRKEKIALSHAAMLHDIGKIGIKDNILKKPEKLSEEEWKEMRSHSEKGAKILSPLQMKDVSDIVIHHHERYDGKGYPDGLAKNEIPIGAQILSVADAFDAMITKRPYREVEGHKLTVEQALKELIENKGKQFNPKVVDVFVQLIKEHPEIVEKQETVGVKSILKDRIE